MPKLVKPMENNTIGSDDNSLNIAINVRQPKRILHFSDGTLEEYSDDETDSAQINASQSGNNQELVDPATLTWGPWFWYKTWRAGSGTLAIVDTIGEFLASFFGITTPKYYFELEEYKRNSAKAEEQKEQQKGWNLDATGEPVDPNNIRTQQPEPVNV